MEDTGIGIDREVLKRIFQPYEQGDSSLTAGGGGIGLGLSISRHLAELHGGSLEAESEPGQGSIFRLTLPIAAGADRIAVSPSGAAEPSKATLQPEAAEEMPDVLQSASEVQADAGKPRVLLVDDDPVNLHILKEMMPRQQYHVSAVNSAHEALKRMDDQEWDLVVTDVMMPRMSGYELTRTIRRPIRDVGTAGAAADGPRPA
ncbi:response regulator [Paenibacillus sp. P25]|nr:response regulator [Paenibacillus sp. P25]